MPRESDESFVETIHRWLKIQIAAFLAITSIVVVVGLASLILG